ncbi:heart- and neural crest derivatives-expressed protein 2-like [Mya arenaria]|uniref:heart- and neural crest derivatives-expressed protein 2-like n=1 Tax=Mya arenaria TaxID=6604 RepID=UPI0022E658A3|nr:heart- and neural crest derivatives-expressed protein 2-like [Mya arenaria]
MSISVGGYHGGFGHPAHMGITSGQDYFAAASHYPPAPMTGYPELPVSDREYFNNWVLNGTTDVAMTPEAYGSPYAPGGTPSPPMMGFNHFGYTDGVQQGSLGQWSELAHNIPASELHNYETYTNAYGDRCLRRRTSANRKERRRTVSINNAFSNLRGTIPNVPSDTKLSKIKTLRLAISYISYLSDILDKGDPDLAPDAFKADISRKRERRSLPVDLEKKVADSCDSDACSESGSTSSGDRKPGARTGWPETVWESELRGTQSSAIKIEPLS